MSDNVEIRESMAGDLQAIEALYPAAFPDEDLLPLVRDLLRASADTLSLVATIDSQLAGHVMFTKCHVSGSDATDALLAPLAVAPARQRQGTGSAIVHEGLRRLENAGVGRVYVLGDPAYYGRFDFRPESSVLPPYDIPPEWATAWQSLDLSAATAPRAGKIRLPEPWLQPALWAP
jgi:putative acetyltransferase